MITYLKSHPIKAALFAGFLLAGMVVIGWEISVISHKLTQLAQSGDESSPVGPTGAANVSFNVGATKDPRVNKLMTQFHLTRQAATYIAQAKTELVSQSDTSVHFIQTFSDDFKADTTITISPDQHYTPTQDDLARAERMHAQIYNVKFSATSDGDNKERITLQ